MVEIGVGIKYEEVMIWVNFILIYSIFLTERLAVRTQMRNYFRQKREYNQ